MTTTFQKRKDILQELGFTYDDNAEYNFYIKGIWDIKNEKLLKQTNDEFELYLVEIKKAIQNAKKVFKLEPKHLSPYSTFNLKLIDETGEIVLLLGTSCFDDFMIGVEPKYQDWASYDSGYKPILRPLKDLFVEITHEQPKLIPPDKPKRDFPICKYEKEVFVPVVKLKHEFGLNPLYWNNHVSPYLNNTLAHCLPFFIVEKLFEWHFDFFDLIGKKIGYDINELKTKLNE